MKKDSLRKPLEIHRATLEELEDFLLDKLDVHRADQIRKLIAESPFYSTMIKMVLKKITESNATGNQANVEIPKQERTSNRVSVSSLWG